MFESGDWEAVRTAATVVSACCAVIAALVSLAIWRKAKASDLGKQIVDGDAAVLAHADRALADIRETVDEMRADVSGTRNAVARIEARQANEEKHVLRPRDLGAIHEKVNRVAEDLAATRAQSTAENRMLSEQLRIIQNLLNERSHRSGRGQ